ncbi:MAG: ABC transporter substrate-binding protein [Candidatus Krumholzibacteriia bacterium]
MSTSVLRRIACAIACCAFILSAGCGTKPEIIGIGAILPLTGAGAEIGNQHLHGLQLAIEELNVSNPNIRFELVVASDQNDPGAALEAFKDQLIDKKILVSFVIARASCLAIAHQAEVEFVPVFANCRHPLITTTHGNTFRIVPSTTLEIKTTARFLTESLKVDRAAALYFNDDDGNDAAKAFRNELPQSGVRLLAIEPFIDDGAAVKSAVGVALAQDPGAVYVFGAGKAAAGVLAALRAAGYRGAVIGSSDFRDPGFAALAGESLEGCYYSVPAIELSGYLDFTARYRKRFNVTTTASGVFEYDAMRIVAKAVDIKRLEKINIASALKKVGDFSGAGGNYTYVEREWLPRMSVVRVQGDSAVAVY